MLVEAVDGDALEPEQVVGDEAARPEREDHRDRRRERRRDQRQQHARVDRGRAAQRGSRAARRGEREQEAERPCRRRPTSAASSRLFQNARIWCRSVRIAAMPAVVNVPWSVSIRASSIAERIDDEQRQQQPQHERRPRRRPGRCGRPRGRAAGAPAVAPATAAPAYGFRTSATQRSTMRLRFAPA